MNERAISEAFERLRSQLAELKTDPAEVSARADAMHQSLEQVYTSLAGKRVGIRPASDVGKAAE